MYKLIQDRRDAVKRWRKKNPDKVKKQKQRYRKKYRHVLGIRLREWRKRNSKRVAMYKKREREGK